MARIRYPVTGKRARRSRVLWLNGLTALTAVGTALLGTDLVRQHPTATLWIAAGIAAANALLRFDTTTAIRW